MRRTLFILCLFLFAAAPSAWAEPMCPGPVAIIEGNPVSMGTADRLRPAYLALGCKPDFVVLPGRRGLAAFNDGIVDGEISRIPVVEKHYQRDFVRSEPNLFWITGSLYRRPGREAASRSAFGYLIGVVWMERYAVDAENGIGYRDAERMIRAFNSGQLHGVLSNDFEMAATVARGMYKVRPERERKLFKAPAHHYLGAEFAPFMARLSEHLARHELFKDFNPTTNQTRSSPSPELSWHRSTAK